MAVWVATNAQDRASKDSARQEELTDEIHRPTFEDRPDRVRTNLHLVFSDLGSVRQLQVEGDVRAELVLRRLERTVRVFRGELEAVQDLLYRWDVHGDIFRCSAEAAKNYSARLFPLPELRRHRRDLAVSWLPPRGSALRSFEWRDRRLRVSDRASPESRR